MTRRICDWRAVAATVLAAGLTLSGTPADAIEIRLKDAAPDRIERQRRADAGALPLPGTPQVGDLDSRLADKGFERGRPVLLRIFKSEAELEVFMERDGAFQHFATYPICHWSGSLGPKLEEGDKQSPEGFYTVTKRQIHRSGKWPRSLNLGFPNVLDRSLKRTGSYILVHGGCTSVGCYAMTNPVMEEIFEIVHAALDKGQGHVPVHVFPFHMTKKNLAKHANSEWHTFWSDLAAGYESFNRTRRAPKIAVCQGRYRIDDAAAANAGSEPDKEAGGTGGPFAVCAQTARVLRALDLLQRIARRPSRWRSLASEDKTLLTETVSAEEIEEARQGRTRFGSSVLARRGIDRRSKRRVACDTRKASCKRHLALKRGSARGKSRRASASRSRSR